MTRWEPVIGLEVHVQLATHSKAFSPSAIEFGAPPNSLTDPTVLGLPGALPSFNARALEYAVRLGVATGSEIRARSRFARKQYFYPDLPKGYQISQFDEPICEHGEVEFVCDGEIRKVRLTRIHLEEDAGKLTHRGKVSLVDLNRAGVALCEVVTEPEIRSAQEAAEYMRGLHQLVRWLGICEGNMEQGHLRCDANVSLRAVGTQPLGTRAELKNINSFRFVQRAIEHEILRQTRILDSGGRVVQETRLWDSDAGLSHSMRSKEEANDYRYFPDPDLPPLVVDDAAIAEARRSLPTLPVARYRVMRQDHGLTDVEARTLTGDSKLADYYDQASAAHLGRGGEPKAIAKWMLSELLRALDGESVAGCKVTPPQLSALVGLIEDDTISGKIAKKVFASMFESGEHASVIVDREGLQQLTDTSAIEAIAAEVIAANPGQAEQYRAGKTKLIGFFVGQVMKKTRGQANPAAVNQILAKLLGS